jgi:DNA polymerase-4
VRLLGVGVSGLADWIQDDLFDDDADEGQSGAGLDVDTADPAGPTPGLSAHVRAWAPGMDVEHDELGPGWVWGAGLRRVTVRFETALTGPGPVRTFPADDPSLHRRAAVALSP